MNPQDKVSTGRVAALALCAAVLAIFVPVGVKAAAPELFRLVDGNSDERAEVKDGEVQVGDGKGPVTVDGDTRGKPATLLMSGICPALEQLPQGTVVTAIFHTGPTNNFPGSRLDIYPGDKDQTTALMSLKIYGGTGNVGDQNAIYSSDVGFRVTGDDWDVVCDGIHTGSGTNGGLWSIFGYAP